MEDTQPVHFRALPEKGFKGPPREVGVSCPITYRESAVKEAEKHRCSRAGVRNSLKKVVQKILVHPSFTKGRARRKKQ